MTQRGPGGPPSRQTYDWTFVQASEMLVEALHAYAVALQTERGHSRSAMHLSEKLCAVGVDVCSEVSDLVNWKEMLEQEAPTLPRPHPHLRIVHSAD